MFAKSLKSLLILMLTTLATWTAALGLWRNLGHRPSNVELAIGLIGLPIAFSVLVSRWRRTPGEEKAEPSAQEPAPAAPLLDSRRWSILATDIMTPLGYTPSDVIQALKDHQRPALDATLHDAQGFPIFAARVPDMDMATLRASLSPDFTSTNACTEDCIRAVAMLRDICRNLALTAADEIDANAPVRAVLSIRILLPERWPTTQRDAILDLMRSTIAAHWKADIEAFAYAVGNESPHSIIEALTLPTPDNDAFPPRLTMLAACDSYICADTVTLLEQRRQLLTSLNLEGKVPGEAAAGVLLAAPIHAHYFGQDPSAVMTAATVSDAETNPGPVLPGLLNELLSSTGIETQTIKTIVSDGDHRGRHQSEVLELATQSLPHLDPARGCLWAASGCGHTGAAALPLALALSANTCAEGDGNVLYVSMKIAKFRTMLILEPTAKKTTGDTLRAHREELNLY